MKTASAYRSALAAACALVLTSLPASALVWDTDGNAATGYGGTGTWDTATLNWNTASDGSGALQAWPVGGTTATFGTGATSSTVTVDAGGISTGLISISPGGTHLFSGGSLTSTIASNNNALQITGSTATTVTFSNQLRVGTSVRFDTGGSGSTTLNVDNLHLTTGATPQFFGTGTVNLGTVTKSSGTAALTLGGGSGSSNAKYNLTGDNTAVNGTLTINKGVVTGFTNTSFGTGSISLAGAGATAETQSLQIGTAGVTISRNITFATGANSTGDTRIVGSSITSGTATYSGNLTMAETGASLTAAAGGTTVFSGVISDGTAALGITKTGAGTVQLNGTANRYDGVTTVTAGTLSVASFGNGGAGQKTGVTGNNTEFTITVADTTGLAVGMTASGTNIASGATITDITGTTVTLSAANTGAVSTTVGFGYPNSLGNSSNAASNLVIDNGTLQYTGGGQTSDRLFQVGRTTAGGTATLDASGTGALDLTNTGNITFGTTNQARNLVLTGTNTGNNTLAASLGNNGTGVTTVAKDGTGTWALSGTHAYTGATTINNGTLLISGTGSINNTSGIILNGGAFRYNSSTALTQTITNNGGSVTGSGNLGNVVLDGTGSVDPGNSPGLLTAGSTEPVSGLDYNFEFTLLNTIPTWASVENDVLRLTGATPFASAMDSDNILSLYLDAATYAALADGDLLIGGFYADSGDFLSSVNGATIVAYYQDALGSTSYNGQNYSLLTAGSFGISTAANSQFAAGGYLSQFAYTAAVPEPSTYALLGLGSVALWILRRKNRV